MPLTTSFKERVLQRANTDPEFVVAMLGEAMQALVAGETNIGTSLLRDCINATVGFSDLSEATGIPDKSLQRMFGKGGNPQAINLFKVISTLLEHNNASLEVKAVNRAA